MKKRPNVKKLTKADIILFVTLNLFIWTLMLSSFGTFGGPIAYEDLKYDTIVVEKKYLGYVKFEGERIYLYCNGEKYMFLGYGENDDSLPSTLAKVNEEFIHIGDTYEIAYYDHPISGKQIYGLKEGNTEYFNAYKAVNVHNSNFKRKCCFLIVCELLILPIIVVPKIIEVSALRKIEKNQEHKKEKRRKQIEQRNANIKKE